MINPNENRPTEWFDDIYLHAKNKGDHKEVPWAHEQTHPHFLSWLKQYPMSGHNKKALVVGCGLGDDAIELEQKGFQVTAFDVSPTAIQLCQERFPGSQVDFQVIDLFASTPHLKHQFDFVLEIFTVQALPPKYEAEAIQKITQFVAPSGQLLVIAMVSEQARSFKHGPPWLLTPNHRSSFEQHGFSITNAQEVVREKGGEVYITHFQK